MLYRMDNAGDGRWRLAESDVRRHEAVDVASQAGAGDDPQDWMILDIELVVRIEMDYLW